MKFTEHLSAHLTPEWRSQYIRYEVSLKLSQKSCVFQALSCVKFLLWVRLCAVLLFVFLSINKM